MSQTNPAAPQVAGAGESVEGAITRLRSVAEAQGIVFEVVSDTEFRVKTPDETLTVRLDPASHSYTFDQVQVWEQQGVGDHFAGPRTSPADGVSRPFVLASGQGKSTTVSVVKEPATGKWEASANTPAERFLYSNLVQYGWHNQLSDDPMRMFKWTLIAVAAIFAVGFLMAGTLAAVAWYAGAF
ncbi:hypothetical protein [Gordonia sp. (in: high G+C Gram-positive bacteria)]|uniref:hypothetical protein n=2 Tax=Gordonia sp. (in: high G+C Gram-positive bacteria) TaxID=84139 RepID=UPI003C72FC62